MPASFELYDDDAWDHGVEIFKAWKATLYNETVYRAIAKKVLEHTVGERAIEICAPQKGAFNVYFRLHFASGRGAMMRFPIPAYFQYAEEKIASEVATMKYISDHTSIPIPFVFHHGMKEESPCGLGPFMIMEWIDNKGDMSDVVNTPGLTLMDPPVLDPNIDKEKLTRAYGQMADVLLQLSLCRLPSIGCLGFSDGDDEDEPKVMQRPLSLNIAQLGNFARIPHFQLPTPSKIYAIASEYYVALADMHLLQLSYQRNFAIESADDCRKKYLARQLFRKLAVEDRLALQGFKNGPFPLWGDDLRPTNVLVNQDEMITAVIDWEFTYAAPADFSFSPPWWLLLQAPDDWPEGLDDWAAKYEPVLATFLSALQEKERDFMAQGRLKESDLLSPRMRESWESGHFWLTYAARKSWAFDGIYWKFLDEKYFGKNESGDFMERLKHLPSEQVDAMEEFVQRKLKEKDEKTLSDWYAPDAQANLPPDILLIGTGSSRTAAPTDQGKSSIVEEVTWI